MDCIFLLKFNVVFIIVMFCDGKIMVNRRPEEEQKR